MTHPSDSQSTSESTADVDPHADKYNDPRVQITRRGIWLGVLVVVLGMFGAAASIYARRTRLEKSTEFWGDHVIGMLQLGERIYLLPESGTAFDQVELTRTPGIGHLRRLLLDERNYDWTTVTDEPIQTIVDAPESYCVRLRFEDPTAKRFPDLKIVADLKTGWIGSVDGETRVKVAERKQQALRKFLEQVVNYRDRRAAANQD